MYERILRSGQPYGNTSQDLSVIHSGMVEAWCINDNHAASLLIRVWIYDMLDLIRLRRKVMTYTGDIVLPEQSIDELPPGHYAVKQINNK